MLCTAACIKNGRRYFPFWYVTFSIVGRADAALKHLLMRTFHRPYVIIYGLRGRGSKKWPIFGAHLIFAFYSSSSIKATYESAIWVEFQFCATSCIVHCAGNIALGGQGIAARKRSRGRTFTSARDTLMTLTQLYENTDGAIYHFACWVAYFFTGVEKLSFFRVTARVLSK